MLVSTLVLTALGAACGLGLGWAARFRVDPDPLIDWVDKLLPQTQCGRCSFSGCRPYAEAITQEGVDINQCPPGGSAGIHALAALLGRAPKPLNPKHGKLIPPRVVIDEQACIGCTLCIQACPVDAIVGASKLMHTIIESECTGCKLCLPPCPVDCIDIIETGAGERPPALGMVPVPALPDEQACIRCGDCIDACPEGLEPQTLHKLISNGEIRLAASEGLSRCTECGDCEPVCPSHIPLLDWIRVGKQAQQLLEQEEASVQIARRRFFDRKDRLSRLEKERAEKMQQRKQALQDKAAQQERIRASIARAQNKRP